MGCLAGIWLRMGYFAHLLAVGGSKAIEFFVRILINIISIYWSFRKAAELP